jgi:ABC-type lipoprotein release transport system permease subunit
LIAPALSILSGWIPAIIATRQDPAVILREQ